MIPLLTRRERDRLTGWDAFAYSYVHGTDTIERHRLVWGLVIFAIAAIPLSPFIAMLIQHWTAHHP